MAATFSTTRLYIGNLSSSVDEYTLIQVCVKYGKIAKLDYLFHKTGPAKGKPRGYAFVEYSTKEEALRAMVALHDKLLRGRNIIVTAASEQNPEDAASAGGGKVRSRHVDASKPTAISLLKGQGVTGASTTRKIAALEAKLSALRKSKPSGEPMASTSEIKEGDGVEGEQWLDSLVGPSSSIVGGKDGAQEKEGDTTPSSSKRRKTEIDPVAAGLPARPLFDAKTPPRE